MGATYARAPERACAMRSRMRLCDAPTRYIIKDREGVKAGAEIVKNKEKMAGYGCEKIPYIVVKTLENIRRGTI